MSEPENFLTRWSRRKLDAEEPAVPATEATPQTADKPSENAEVAKAGVAQEPEASSPVFDPATLPPLDSIGAETDITAFMKAGIPSDLRLAALRRAWVADPAIRDFKGLAENDWDFTVPNEAMGFGTIDPGFDTKKMLADVFGETPRPAPPAREAREEAEQAAPAPDMAHSPVQKAALESVDASSSVDELGMDAELVQRNNNVATPSKENAPDEVPIARRRSQGGALPQ